MIAKRPTKKIEHLGLYVRKGAYGFSAHYKTLEPCISYRAKVYKTANECVDAALNGARPIKLPAYGHSASTFNGNAKA